MIKHEQQRVAVGPGNAHFICIHQVSSDAATLRRYMCRHSRLPAGAAAAAAAAALMCICNLMIKIIMIN